MTRSWKHFFLGETFLPPLPPGPPPTGADFLRLTLVDTRRQSSKSSSSSVGASRNQFSSFLRLKLDDVLLVPAERLPVRGVDFLVEVFGVRGESLSEERLLLVVSQPRGVAGSVPLEEGVRFKGLGAGPF